MTDDVYLSYRHLGMAILYYACEDYKSIYRMYLRGETTETIYKRHIEYMHDDFIETLINLLLGETSEDLMLMLERQVRKCLIM